MMLHARNDYMRFQDPWNKIPQDEPVMLFRGQDKHFVTILLSYLVLLEDDDNPDLRLVEAVRNHIERGKRWPYTRVPDMPRDAEVLPLEVDITYKLRNGNGRMGTRDPKAYSAGISVADANEAADEIDELREEVVALRARIHKLEANPKS